MKNLITALLLVTACASDDADMVSRDEAGDIAASAWCARAEECFPGGRTVNECADRLGRVLAERMPAEIEADLLDTCLESIADSECGGTNAGWGPDCWAILD